MKRIVISLLCVSLSAGAYAETVAISGAKVHTAGPGGTIDNATIVITDGRITAVGQNVAVPAGATIVDAAGKIVTPGLFSSAGSLGLVEVGSSAGPVDSQQRGDKFTASFDIADAYNPRSTLVAINRIEGVTRAAVLPSPGYPDDTGARGSVLSGLGAIVNLGDSDAMDKRSAAMVVTLGESGSGLAGGTRTGAWLELRDALAEARDYRDNRLDAERGNRYAYNHSLSDLAALQGVLSGDIPVVVSIHRARDIEVLISLVREFGLRAIIRGGTEAWMLADELAAANIAVIAPVTYNLPGNFDHINAQRGSATILADAGVAVALTDSASETHNARNLTQMAGNAVADGMDWEAALRAITIVPAQMYGVADSVGSIEAGKQADLVIWPADPFELTNYPEQVYINGEPISMESRQTLLRDRYLDPASSTPPAYRK